MESSRRRGHRQGHVPRRLDMRTGAAFIRVMPAVLDGVMEMVSEPPTCLAVIGSETVGTALRDLTLARVVHGGARRDRRGNDIGVTRLKPIMT